MGQVVRARRWTRFVLGWPDAHRSDFGHARSVSENLPGRLKDADEIWHLGDVCDPTTLAEFEMLRVPLRIVAGNCDEHPWPLSLTLEREGVKFFLTHIPPARERVAPGIRAVLHGHTHVPRDEWIGGVRWLNPGCITRPNRGAPASYAWLDVQAGDFTWELVPL